VGDSFQRDGRCERDGQESCEGSSELHCQSIVASFGSKVIMNNKPLAQCVYDC